MQKRNIHISALIFIMISYIFLLFQNQRASGEINPLINNAAEAASRHNMNSITISAAGDCTLGNNNSSEFYGTFDYVFDKVNRDYGYFFRNVRPTFLEDDLTIVNLEGALTDADAEAASLKEYNFKGRKDYALILKAGGIDAVNLANNHIGDYGSKGIRDTVNALKQNGIQYFGNGYKAVRTIKGIKVILLGYKGWTDSSYLKKQIARDLKAARRSNDLVIVSFHWGEENNHKVIDIQYSLGRFAVENGADLVLGHHPHVLQGIEQYRGKYIAYSLGNFCFGGNRNPSDKNTMIFQETFNFDANKKLLDTSTNIIPCKISSTLKYNNFQPAIVKSNNE